MLKKISNTEETIYNLDVKKEYIEEVISVPDSELDSFEKNTLKLTDTLERKIKLAWIMIRRNQLEKALNYLYEIQAFDWMNIINDHIFLTGYYHGCDGNWHSYDDSSSCGDSSGGDDGCDDGCGGCLCLGGCVVACAFCGDSCGCYDGTWGIRICNLAKGFCC